MQKVKNMKFLFYACNHIIFLAVHFILHFNLLFILFYLFIYHMSENYVYVIRFMKFCWGGSAHPWADSLPSGGIL